ncbi:MAG TPA: class I tRNA ligase family protein, partial [Patescibacteria group bacterium]|nr:class I tRNA ligase family protein [Patescibacteria group bacterium]
MKRYNHRQVEKKWQKFWAAKKFFSARDFDARKKQYVLFEFPYPSGAGLHVGHLRPYVATDILARWKRMEGANVLYPIGWDAFGLPTENYAIKNKIHPRIATDRNIKTFRRQLKATGLSLDWNREVDTTDPEYYKWTQWIFLKLFEAGLAYRAEIPINWCPFEKTGLANEEVVNGRHERCGTPVEKKLMKQWVIKITKYADRLIEDLELVDYPERVKTQQINWIGKSEGADIVFPIVDTQIKRFVLLHGRQGSPQDIFFPWLAQKLLDRGYKVEIPELPN